MLIATLLLLAAAGAATGAYITSYKGGSHTQGQVQNILIVASITGFNDSVNHGVPQNPWPVAHVARGTTVNITVVNVDKQPHGFQVEHYFDSNIATVAPGQTLNVTFVANVTGTFRIYCVIPCTVHWAMQSGELIVS